MQDSFRRIGATAFFGAALVLAAPRAEAIQCAIFARSVTGLDLSGDAWQWWGHASGTYSKGNVPKPGAVLVFMRSAPMRYGHVSVVSKVVNSREILVDHANWGTRGAVARNVPVMDDSAANDWSSVRVAFGGGYGRSNPTYGFIYGTAATTKNLVEASARSDDAADQAVNQTEDDRDQVVESDRPFRGHRGHRWIKLAVMHGGSSHGIHSVSVHSSGRTEIKHASYRVEAATAQLGHGHSTAKTATISVPAHHHDTHETAVRLPHASVVAGKNTTTRHTAKPAPHVVETAASASHKGHGRA